MRILITNDDGIHAPGLGILENIASALSDDLIVVAPESDQSGVSHSMSLNEPLRLRQISEKRYAVRGTPTDCVLMGVRHLLKDKAPDLVLSGVNRGRNVAEDITYSGTVAGAIEGTLLGIPSLALSQAHGPDDPPWACAEIHGPAVIRKLLAYGFSKGLLFNINFPPCRPEDIAGTSITVQGRRNQQALIDVVEREDFRRNSYYWLAFAREDPDPIDGSDLWAMAKNRISITPLKLDMTDVAAIERLSALFD